MREHEAFQVPPVQRQELRGCQAVGHADRILGQCHVATLDRVAVHRAQHLEADITNVECAFM